MFTLSIGYSQVVKDTLDVLPENYVNEVVTKPINYLEYTEDKGYRNKPKKLNPSFIINFNLTPRRNYFYHRHGGRRYTFIH